MILKCFGLSNSVLGRMEADVYLTSHPIASSHIRKNKRPRELWEIPESRGRFL